MGWRAIAAAGLLLAAAAGCDPELNDNECRTNAECAAILRGTVCSPERWCVLPESVLDPDMMPEPDMAPEPDLAPEPEPDMGPMTADRGPDMAPMDGGPMDDMAAGDMAPEADAMADMALELDAMADMAPEVDMAEVDMMLDDMGEPVGFDPDAPPM